jgi:transcriptional regulator with XRE-family HTH domain
MQNQDKPVDEWSLQEMLAWLCERYSEAEVAKRVQFDQSTINRIARGVVNPRYSNGKRIEQFFLQEYRDAVPQKAAA